MTRARSTQLYSNAQKLIPGGVNSPARAWGSVGGDPLFLKKASGSRIWDVDDNELIDYVCSWGPMILGHAHPAVIDAAVEATRSGTSFGAPTELEVEMARRVVDAVPSIEAIRFVSSGTEATMSALRLARARTGRSKILKFNGGYHGHEDALLVEAGSGLANQGIASSAGVHPEYAASTLVAEFNDVDSVRLLLQANTGEVAAVIVEPIAGNMGVVTPEPGFLEELRELTREHGVLLIFDEVISGFRVSLGGAQAVYGVMPDITCLGKIVGGGFPVGAYGASAEIMSEVAPLGPMYQAGTLSGNPVAMAAGIATIDELSKPGVYEGLRATTDKLADGLIGVFDASGVQAAVNRVCDRSGGVRCFLPWHGRQRCISTTIAVRGMVRFNCTYRCRYRANARRGEKVATSVVPGARGFGFLEIAGQCRNSLTPSVCDRAGGVFTLRVP